MSQKTTTLNLNSNFTSFLLPLSMRATILSMYLSYSIHFYIIQQTTEEDGKDPSAVQKPKKKNEKTKQTILLIAIKNGIVYSYVRESKLGKILGLNAKYKPRAISKHGTLFFAYYCVIVALKNAQPKKFLTKNERKEIMSNSFFSYLRIIFFMDYFPLFACENNFLSSQDYLYLLRRRR